VQTVAQHVPVLLEESLRLLAPERGGTFVDCTLGLGGHSEAILERYPDVSVIGLDRDPEALELAGERLAVFGERVTLLQGCFDQLEERLEERELAPVAGILADLGVSSFQLETPQRGFSFVREGPLDMRMNTGGQLAEDSHTARDHQIGREHQPARDSQTAKDIVNGYSEEALSRIFKEYGEEPLARRVAREIVRRRVDKPIETTGELGRLIEQVKPAPRGVWRRGGQRSARRGRGGSRQRRIHPATQVFQALRIEVNQELDQVKELLEQSMRMLDTEGRLVVISYHSGEDRIVKHRLRELATGEIEPITGRPRAETQIIEVLTKKPLRPTDEELSANPRARSARLRAARRF
jgi:16S rRNA (cytosine1402-N4)-methyltransferase